ncbi:hypothetical protein Xaut_3241 [Xanthobacter versatilis]|uniref:Uncharacterized protein n=1 Tax=Xanthobacter autotrophicus (strain ATCC BAA-1158 / Py2) TaxID=78245 RepID=A7IKC7_XANP2|nr:hypothetical protein Xaut_3241 [Xanthobacter autotrophicus Py2]
MRRVGAQDLIRRQGMGALTSARKIFRSEPLAEVAVADGDGEEAEAQREHQKVQHEFDFPVRSVCRGRARRRLAERSPHGPEAGPNGIKIREGCRSGGIGIS